MANDIVENLKNLFINGFRLKFEKYNVKTPIKVSKNNWGVYYDNHICRPDHTCDMSRYGWYGWICVDGIDYANLIDVAKQDLDNLPSHISPYDVEAMLRDAFYREFILG